MNESLARIHVHELHVSDEPIAANDNHETAPVPKIIAANDNEIGPVGLASSEPTEETAQLLSETRSRLGLPVEAPIFEEEAVESAAPEELPQLEPENVEVAEQVAPEKGMAILNVESIPTAAEAHAAQSAGGASDNEGGGDDGTGGGTFGGFGEKMEGSHANVKGGGRLFSGLGKVLKLALIPLLLFGGLVSLGLNTVKYLTNKIFNLAGMKGGGGGSKPSSGGGHGGGSKPSGGGGHH